MRQYVQHIIHWTSIIIFIQIHFTVWFLHIIHIIHCFVVVVAVDAWIFFSLNLIYDFAIHIFHIVCIRPDILPGAKMWDVCKRHIFFCFLSFSIFFHFRLWQTVSSFVIQYEIIDQISSISEQRWYGMIRPPCFHVRHFGKIIKETAKNAIVLCYTTLVLHLNRFSRIYPFEFLKSLTRLTE